MSASEPTIRARVRAAVLAFVVLVHGMAASPIPNSVSKAHFRNPIAEEEMARWVSILGRVGIRTTDEELIAWLVDVGSSTAEVRKVVMQPFRPILRVTGTGQGWGLFTYPNSYPHRMEIEGRAGTTWRTLFRALDPEHAWMNDKLVFRRVRGVYDDNAFKTRQSYDNFVRWVAGEAFTEFEDLDEIRVKMIRSHVVLPGKPHDPETTTRLVRTLTRQEWTEGP
ncbi:MAG: hypothetical protein H6739_17890 [Alphaproteobacteria bacterium]|nr:hypothetical protein [Alphaproteobacteria bacterium]